MKTMEQLRVVFTRTNQAEIEQTSMPDHSGLRVLVRNEYTMISPGTELALFTGTHVGFGDPDVPWAKYPLYPGYAAVGTVTSHGSADDGLPAVGSRILYYGAHARYGVVAPETDLWYTVPPEHTGREHLLVRFAQIALTSIVARVRPSRHVLVLGAGIVGNLAAQLYRLVPGVETVTVADLNPRRLELARSMGLPHALDPRDAGFRGRSEELTGGSGYDTVVEATGAVPAVGQALQLASLRGQVMLLGSTRGLVELNVYKLVHRKLIALAGAHESYLPSRSAEHRAASIDLIESQQEAVRHLCGEIENGRLIVGPFLQREVRPRDIQEAYCSLRDDPEGNLGILLDWTET